MTAKQRAARAKFKAVVKEASKLRKKNPKLTQAQAVKQAWAISYGKKRAGVGAVKKKLAPTKVKAKKSKRTSEMHTDTKSHNVNIRVVSGIEKLSNKMLDEANAILNKISNYEIFRDRIASRLKYKKYSKEDIPRAKEGLKIYKDNIRFLKKQLAQVKKHIK
jgi:hypothetical protein